MKPGITWDPKDRARRDDDFYSCYAFVSPELTRAEAWAIEQHILREFAEAKPDTLPRAYRSMCGKTELRVKSVLSESWYIEQFWRLLELCHTHGWEAVYDSSS